MTRSLMLVGLIASATLAAPGDTPEVKKLLEQRVAVLLKALDALRAEYNDGKVRFEAIYETALELRSAELELADTPAKRREAHLRLFKLALAADEYVTGGLERGSMFYDAWSMTRSARLKAEIELRRAGGVPPKGTKPAREPKRD